MIEESLSGIPGRLSHRKEFFRMEAHNISKYTHLKPNADGRLFTR